MELYGQIHRLFRVCLHCGSFQCGPSLFCLRCENDLWRMHSELQNFEIGGPFLRGCALFDWYPDQDRKVSKLLLALKGGRLSASLSYYAQAFIGKYAGRLPQESVFVPCPASRGRLHAQVLAQELSTILGPPVVDSVVKLGTEDQKEKSKESRFKVQMSNEVDFSRQHVIFIDDIVTTGATALAAHQAIGSCRGFEVWCLAHRRQLAAYQGL